MFPRRTLHLHPMEVSSAVRPQPLSDAETLQGALNRVQHAAHLVPQADYWVGIEGGVEEHQGSMQAFAWIVISAPPLLGKSRTGTFSVPEDVAALVRQGYELATAVEQVYQHTQVKSTTGAVGVLTEGVIDRVQLYEHAVALALVPFKHAHGRGACHYDRAYTRRQYSGIHGRHRGGLSAFGRTLGFIRRSATVRRPLRVCFPGGWIEAGKARLRRRYGRCVGTCTPTLSRCVVSGSTSLVTHHGRSGAGLRSSGPPHPCPTRPKSTKFSCSRLTRPSSTPMSYRTLMPSWQPSSLRCIRT